MNKDVIPFLPARFGSFVGLVFTFSVLGIVILVAQYRFRWWQVGIDFVEQMYWKRKIRGSRLKRLQSCGDSFVGQPTSKTQRDVWNEVV